MLRQVDKAREDYMKGMKKKYQKSMKTEIEPTQDQLNQWADLNTEDNKNRFEAEIYVKALQNMSAASKKIGTVMLLTMWHVWTKGLYLYTSEAQSMQDWAENAFVGQDVDMDYMKALGRIVDCIFVWSHQYELAGKPIKTDAGQKVVVGETTEHDEISLITGKGLISKLKENATFIRDLEDEHDKLRFIKMIAGGTSRRAIQAEKARFKNKKRKSNLSGLKIQLTKKDMGNTINMIINKQTLFMTHKQYKAFISRFSQYISITDEAD